MFESPETIEAILTAIFGTSIVTQLIKRGIEGAVGAASSALPVWAKTYVLPLVGAFAFAVAAGSPQVLTEMLPAHGVTGPVLLAGAASLLFRLFKGAPDES